MLARARNSAGGLLAAILLGVLFLLPVQHPSLRALWALSFLGRVPWPLRLVMALVVVASSFPSVQRWLWFTLERVRPLPAMRVTAAGGLLFVLLREKQHSGDGLRKIELLAKTSLRNDPYAWKEPLDTLAARLAAAIFKDVGLSAEEAVAFLSVCAGMIFLVSVIYLGRLLAPDRARRVLFGVGLLALGSTQLWFGHVENYSLVTSATYVGVCLALAHGRGLIPLWTVGLATGFAVSFHPQALFAQLSLVWLLRRREWPRQLVVLVGSGLLVPALTVAALWSLGVPSPWGGRGFAGDTQLFLRWYEALDPWQVGQALLNLWLLIPGLPVLVPAALIACRRPIDGRARYLATTVAGLLAYHFSFHNHLPRAQDWDLFAIVGPGLALLLFYVLLRDDEGPSWRERAVLLVTVFSVLFTAAWVGTNRFVA